MDLYHQTSKYNARLCFVFNSLLVLWLVEEQNNMTMEKSSDHNKIIRSKAEEEVQKVEKMVSKSGVKVQIQLALLHQS